MPSGGVHPITFGGAGLITVGITRNLRPPLHGAARWASEAELVGAGLRSRQGIVLGRKGGRLLVFGGSEHVMLHAPTRSGKALSYGCVSALSDFCSASENTFASIKQNITARMNLWLNPRVCTATEASDFDLRDLRERRMSLYLGVSPDNLARVAPLCRPVSARTIGRRRGTDPSETWALPAVLPQFACQD